jgi:hypothetical protein
MDAKFRISVELATRKPIILQISGPVLTRTTRSLLGRNHRKINKKQQSFDYRRTSPEPNKRLGG